MKKNLLIGGLIVIAVVAGIFLAPLFKPEQEQKIDIAGEIATTTGNSGFLMAVIDDQRIMVEGKVYVSLKKDYESKLNDVREDADKEKEALKKENDRIAGLRSSATQEEFNREVEKFAKRQKESSEKIGNQLKELEKAYVEKINQIKAEEIDKILGEIAKEQKLSFITSKVMALYSVPALDITETVLFRLNKRITKAKID